jgi:hypothetical protein
MTVLDRDGWAALGVEIVSAKELAERVHISPAAVRYHCTDGQLLGVAFKIGPTWWIPAGDADRFAERYRPQSGGRAGSETRRRLPANTPCRPGSTPTRGSAETPSPGKGKAHEQ